jgi:hypothetical protein
LCASGWRRRRIAAKTNVENARKLAKLVHTVGETAETSRSNGPVSSPVKDTVDNWTPPAIFASA